jgi:hypothetical protein
LPDVHPTNPTCASPPHSNSSFPLYIEIARCARAHAGERMAHIERPHRPLAQETPTGRQGGQERANPALTAKDQRDSTRARL